MIIRYCASVIISAVFLLIIPAVVFSSPEAAYRYNEEGIKELQNGDYEGAINDLKQAHLYEPSNAGIKKNLAIAYNNYAFSLMSKGMTQRAIEMFEYSLSYDSENAHTLYNLGQAYYKSQNMPKALQYLEKAFKINPSIKGLQSLLERVRKEEGAEKGFEKLETMHFTIASAPDVPVSQLSYIRTYLEEAYGRMGMFLDYYPKHKFVTILYSEQSYAHLLNNKPHWAMAFFDGKLRIPVNKFKYSNEDVIKIIYHEYAHAVVFDLAKGNCPLWLNEGIASRAEDFIISKDKALCKKYIEHLGLIPFRGIPAQFSGANIDVITLMYIESYTLVNFILRRVGSAGLRQILNYLGAAMNIDGALQAALEETSDEFSQKWERYLVEEYGIAKLRYR